MARTSPQIWISIKDHDLVVKTEKSVMVEVWSVGALAAEVAAWISLLSTKRANVRGKK